MQNEISIHQLGEDNAPPTLLQHNESSCNLRWYLKIEQSQLEKTKLEHAQYANPYGSPFVLNSNQHHPQIRTEAALATSSQATLSSPDSAV